MAEESSPDPPDTELVEENLSTDSDAQASAPTKPDDDQVEHLLRKIDELTLELDAVKKRVNKHDRKLAKLEKPEIVGDIDYEFSEWREVGSGMVAPAPETDENIVGLSLDVYSFIAAYPWTSMPFWLAVIVAGGLQCLLLFLLLDNQTDFQSENKLNIPENVDNSVRISQALLLIIAMLTQADLLLGIKMLVQGVPSLFRGNDRFKDVTALKWSLSCMVRILTGVLGLLASFVLSIQSDNVFDVVLNVLGIEFIAELDDVAFSLGSKGYFGRFVKRATKDVKVAQFHRNKKASWFKNVLHIIIAIFLLLALIASFVYLTIRQDDNFLSLLEMQVQFGDGVIPFLVLFSGCYTAVERSDLGSRRLFYQQAGFEKGGKFGYCRDFGNGESGWTFFVGDIRDPCTAFIIRSEDTSTFSIVEAGLADWETPRGLPMDFIEIGEVADLEDDCGQTLFNTSLQACPVIQVVATKSLIKLVGPDDEIMALEKRPHLDPSLSHAIYYGAAESSDDTNDLVLFTGRRWVWTTTDQFPGMWESTNATEIATYFYNSSDARSGLFRLVEERLLSPGEFDLEQQWIQFISEEVDDDTENGSPLGLEWFYPSFSDETIRDVDSDHPMSYSNLNRQLSFPFADVSRPLESESGPNCEFCDPVTNPCFYEGLCNNDTGVCTCKNGARGLICDKVPSGNGICNLFFNTEEHEYDGGDCCGAFCDDPRCGNDDLLLDPFVTATPTLNWFNESDTEGMLYITNSDEKRLEASANRSLAFGVGFAGNFTFKFKPFRYEHCVNPELAVVRVEVVPSMFLDGSAPDLVFEGLQVHCHGRYYLRTPVFGVDLTNGTLIADIDADNRTGFYEEIRVPFGSRCTFEFEGPRYFRGVSFSGEQKNVTPFLQLEESCPVSVYVPRSKCVFEQFSKDSISVSAFESEDCKVSPVANETTMLSETEFDLLGGDPVLEDICIDDDPSQLLERYRVWELLNSSSEEPVVAPLGHICEGEWDTDDLSILCDDLQVSSFAIRPGGSLWDFLEGFISALKHFVKLVRIDVENKDFPIDYLLNRFQTLNISSLVLETNDLPSSIGEIQNLTHLELRNGTLAFLPTEIGMLSMLHNLTVYDTLLSVLPKETGNLTALETLNVGSNILASLPSEIGMLSRLISLNVESNNLVSLPTEIGLLSSLTNLSAPFNALSTLPTEIGNFTALESLMLGSNNLVSLPTTIGSILSLTTLSVPSNQLEELPSEIGLLVNLTALDVADNNLTALPTEILLLANLSSLNVTNNHQNFTIPTEIGLMTSLEVYGV